MRNRTPHIFHQWSGRRITAIAICFAGLMASPSGAAAIGVRFTYQIVSGTFNAGMFASGAVTGGTASFFVPGATNTVAGAGTATLTALRLTGPSGFFSLLSPLPGPYITWSALNEATFTVNGTQPARYLTGVNETSAAVKTGSISFAPLRPGGGNRYWAIAATGDYVAHFGGSSGAETPGLGAEVRTLVPEPGPGLLRWAVVTTLAAAGTIARRRKSESSSR